MQLIKHVYGELTKWFAKGDEVGLVEMLPILPLWLRYQVEAGCEKAYDSSSPRA